MTFGRGEANIPVGGPSPREQDASLSIARYREPERVPQVADPLNYAERELDHVMRCTKVGCTRCQ